MADRTTLEPSSPSFHSESIRPSVHLGRGRGEIAIWIVAGTLHLLLWLLLRTHALAPLFNDAAHRFGPGADFFALYQAGYSALHGQSLYRFEARQTVIPYVYPFRYLPVSAYTVGALLTLVPPAVAYALWLGVCEICLLHNASATYRRAGGGVRGALLAGVWMVFTPYFLELWIGQFTFLLGTLLFWSVLAMEEGRWRQAQGWWIASVLWKPASLLWAPIWLRRRLFWPGMVACGLLLAANLLYFRFFPGDWHVFLETNVEPLPAWHAGNIGLSGLLYQFTGPGRFFGPARALLSILLVAPALWVTLRTSTRPLPASTTNGETSTSHSPPFWLLGALWTCLYFLIYKDVWEHHLTLILPFLVLGLRHAPSRLLVGVTLLLALPSPFVFYDVPHLAFNVDPQPYFTAATSLIHHSWRVIPLTILYGHWLGLAWSATQQSAEV